MKGKIGAEMTKEEEAYAQPPQYAAPPAHTAVVVPPQTGQADHAGATCWYVFGILATIFCCLPCGVIGLVHAMIAKHEGERGNLPAHKRRMHQAKCWTSWSIALGSLLLILCIIYVAVACNYVRYYEGMDDMDQDMQKGGDWDKDGGDLYEKSSPYPSRPPHGGHGGHGDHSRPPHPRPEH